MVTVLFKQEGPGTITIILRLCMIVAHLDIELAQVAPPPRVYSGGNFIPSRRFGAPTFMHNTSTYQQHRGNGTPQYGKYKGSSTNDNKTSGNAFKSESHWRNTRNVGNGAKGFDTKKKYSVQNIEFEEEEEGETEADALVAICQQHNKNPIPGLKILVSNHQHGHDSFPYDHDPFLEYMVAGAEIRYCEVLRRNTNVINGIAKSQFSDFRNTNIFENSWKFCLIS